MINIGIFSDDSKDRTAEFIDTFLSTSSLQYKITKDLREDSKKFCGKISFDIIVVNFLKESDDIIFKEKISCKNVVLNSDVISNNGSALMLRRPPLTFGLNPKACITASSLGVDCVTCCIQRSFESIFGQQIYQQEIVFNIGCDENTAVSILAATACGLLCGISPEDILLY